MPLLISGPMYVLAKSDGTWCQVWAEVDASGEHDEDVSITFYEPSHPFDPIIDDFLPTVPVSQPKVTCDADPPRCTVTSICLERAIIRIPPLVRKAKGFLIYLVADEVPCVFQKHFSREFDLPPFDLAGADGVQCLLLPTKQSHAAWSLQLARVALPTPMQVPRTALSAPTSRRSKFPKLFHRPKAVEQDDAARDAAAARFPDLEAPAATSEQAPPFPLHPRPCEGVVLPFQDLLALTAPS
eukprot:gnl/Chilomastix_cuspidata/4292.p1 GENE.gnl/Chilomastix_cuspidata/4292~~gnl/Chilomastix_cuspidata/4292.p1  ORF type:complete len:241 (-),score=75.06 gnl/Chilomastix_cuspidata/4292:23-745(-)